MSIKSILNKIILFNQMNYIVIYLKQIYITIFFETIYKYFKTTKPDEKKRRENCPSFFYN